MFHKRKIAFFMNFLAHLFLSRNSELEMVGNFIGDHIKGSLYASYPTKIAEGILLHRAIDYFTDTHPLHKNATNKIRPIYGKYAGVVCDVVYDHFLATNFHRFSCQTLAQFEAMCYTTLLSHNSILPPRVQGFLPKMIKSNRLQSYASLDGMNEALKIMSKYSTLPDCSTKFKAHFSFIRSDIENEFMLFFNDLQNNMPELRNFARNKLNSNSSHKNANA